MIQFFPIDETRNSGVDKVSYLKVNNFGICKNDYPCTQYGAILLYVHMYI